jgi:RNA polymerase sigma factor (sigma-70 family)
MTARYRHKENRFKLIDLVAVGNVLKYPIFLESPYRNDLIGGLSYGEMIPGNFDLDLDIDKKELRREILNAISILPERTQFIVKERFLKGREFGEIAKDLGVGKESVKTSCYDSYKKLGTYLEKKNIDVDW